MDLRPYQFEAIDAVKQCNCCRQTKPLRDFYKKKNTRGTTTTYYSPSCRECVRQASAAYRQSNPEKAKESLKKSYLRNRNARLQYAKGHRKTHPNDWHKRNRSRIGSWVREHYANNPEVYADRKLRMNYGIGLADYEEMLRSQGRKCKLCGAKRPNSSSRKNRLAVDHCHATGKVRGLLCDTCNRAIGLFKESAELMYKAAAYVEKGGDI